MKQFIANFHDGRFDYILAVTTTIEGGFVLYDIISDQQNISISIDNSRDYYSDRETKSYICQDASIRNERTDEGNRSVFQIIECEGSESFDKAGLITFDY